MRSSLFISAAALLLLAASLYTERWYQWGGVALLALASAPWRSFPVNALGVCTAMYCGWQLISAVFVSPVYTAEGLYQPLMLLGSFWAFALLKRDRAIELFGAGVVMAAGLALLGILQYLFALWQLDLSVWHHEDNPVRAAGTFVTPNSFAVALNLFLLPLVVLYLVRGSGRFMVLVLWLFAGLVASQSRGGFVAGLAGLTYITIALGPQALWRERGRAIKLAIGCCLVWAAIASAGKFVVLNEGMARAAASAEWISRGSADRLELYAGTLSLIDQRPIAGYGANMFFSLFESVKPASMREYDFSYAHSDYLQVWLEFGLPGLVLLVAIVATALLAGIRRYRQAPGDLLPLACGAALTTCFVHAAVDFPLYIPFLLCLVGAYLGTMSATGGKQLKWAVLSGLGRAAGVLTNPVRWALAVAVLAWLAQPVIAEIAVYRSIAKLQEGNAQKGIYWQTVARRLEPRHPAHYWAEATIWRNQAVASGDRRAAEMADSLFSQGVQVNPYDVGNLLGRIELHSNHPELLKQPASPIEIVHWAERAAALRPQKLSVRSELVLTLANAGERERARQLARTLLEQYPDSRLARRLAAQVNR